MVPSAVVAGVVVLFAALIVDRMIGDPHSPYHPVALLGQFIGMWGQPRQYSPEIQRLAGVVLWIVTAALFALPFFLFAAVSPFFLYLLGAPVLLKCCFAWRSLEEHTFAVVNALNAGVEEARDQVKLLVSRDTKDLNRAHILSAGYESMTENLTDSIISPIFYFSLFGLVGAAIYRAANTMDAMLGYKDERKRLGWFSARMDDILNFVPSRITVILLLVYFAFTGRFTNALRVMRRDGYKRPGFNGGIVMAAMAGGTGIQFVKPGVYEIGDDERTFDDAGAEIMRAGRFAIIAFTVLASGTLFLLGSLINSTGI
jgi:adenosylcobinamide-phosphate synthase